MAEHSSSSIRTRWAAVGAAVAVTLGAAGIGSYNLVNADVSDGDRPVYIPINPCRLIDTRPGSENVGPKTSPLGPEEIFSPVAHGENGQCTGQSAIPTDATALAMNVTALNASEQTFLTFWGRGDNPGTANLNPAPGQPPTPNAVNTPLSDAGTFNIYNELGNVNVVIDVNGYYAPHDHDDRYPLADDVYTKTESAEQYAPREVSMTFSPLAAAVSSGNTVELKDGCRRAAGIPYQIGVPVALPVGATITSVTLGIRSDAGSADEYIAGLYRTFIDGENANTVPVAAKLGGVGLPADTIEVFEATVPGTIPVVVAEGETFSAVLNATTPDHALCSVEVDYVVPADS